MLLLRFVASLALAAVSCLAFSQPCAVCHPKETAGFAKTAMARSLAPVHKEPEATFDHPFSQTTFTVRNVDGGIQQTLKRSGESQSMLFQYSVGSGEHAVGYLAQVRDHLFQSPLSFYSSRKEWDVAPGYEHDPAPDFTRPVTAECVTCHSGQPQPIPNTLNTYQEPAFVAMGITCERCHGSTGAHLKNPVPGSILNPAKLAPSARDSICEQCHLAGEVRIPNPGKAIADFRPGESLEQSYAVFVVQHGPEDKVKVISQAEQLALSVCKRSSGTQLWCGTCHDPHQQPAEPVAYFRQRCLACHAAKLQPKHAVLENCIGCHMPARPASDGGHTAFTDHRISRNPEQRQMEGSGSVPELKAWREPPDDLRDRNLALALVTFGLEKKNSADVIRGYRMLNRLGAKAQNDPAVSTALGTILLTAKEPAEAVKRFERSLVLQPNYAPYEVNLATALLNTGQRREAIQHLEHAVQLDPLLEDAVSLLNSAYRAQGEDTKAKQLITNYRVAMGMDLSGDKK